MSAIKVKGIRECCGMNASSLEKKEVLHLLAITTELRPRRPRSNAFMHKPGDPFYSSSPFQIWERLGGFKARVVDNQLTSEMVQMLQLVFSFKVCDVLKALF